MKALFDRASGGLVDPALQWRGLRLGGSLAAAVAALFLIVPLVALITRITPAELVAGATTPEARSALAVSVAAVLVALTFVIAVGTPVAYLMARRRTRFTRSLEVLFDLPMVLPPAVAGIALLAAFGRGGLAGDALAASGLEVAFTRAAVVIALVFVAGPMYVRQAQAAFEAIDRNVVEAARTSGAGAISNLLHIELPLARHGLAAGVALSGARALGEFGATIMFAGSLAGVTQTLTLAIYGSMESQLATSFALATLLLAVTVAVSIASRTAFGPRAGVAQS